jgi:hypothetical protein
MSTFCSIPHDLSSYNLKNTNVERVWNEIRATQGECFVYQMTTIKQKCGTYDKHFAPCKAYITEAIRNGTSIESIKNEFILKANVYRLLISTKVRKTFYENPTPEHLLILDGFIYAVIGLTILKAFPSANEFGIMICNEKIGQIDKIY